ncbi:sedoheptulokinase [Plakobranchus ocellatus]|uniref:Sedoheptulokinase n=1 Tax=Plakobranchus ocellatus TaxID=259542 RepID=A0AAV3ZK63_9GAST|nr:sedoheptulokinase [Plakobranchus ocellatus]
MNNFNGERSTRSLVTKNEGQRQQNDARHNTRLGGYEQNLPKNNEGKLADRSLDDESFIHPSTEPEQGTRKMGNQGIKNVQGKLLPLRQLCSSSALLPSRPVNCQRKQPQIMNNDLSDSVSETSTISKRLRRASSAFMTLQSSPAMAKLQKTNTSWQDSGDCQVVNKVRQTSDNSIVYSSKNTANPFQNVKLVPPSNSSNASLKTRSQLEKDAQNTSDIPSNMETDESYSSVENGSALSTMKIAEFSKRPIAIAKKSRGKTVAERFHNFWSQNQTKSNIKTLLSKMKAPLSIIPTKDFKNTRSNTGLATQSSGSASVTHLNKDGHSKAMSTTSSAFYPISNPDHQMLLAPASLKESQLSDQGFSPCSNPGTAQTYLHDRSTANAVGPRLRRRQASARLASPSADLHKTTLPQPQTAATVSPLSVVHILPQASQFQVLHAQLAGCLSLSVSLGDLSEASATGLVNWTDGNLTHTVTACSQAVAAKAGALLIAGCADYLTNKGSPLEPPDVLTTVAGGRFHPNVESILHVVAPPVGSTEISSPSARNYSQEGQGQTESEHSRALLLQVYANCLRFAEERLGLTSLAFPLIGQGIFSIETCVHCFCDSLLVFLHEQGFPCKTPSSSLTSVELIIADARTTDLVAERLHSCLDRLSSLQNFESAITEIFKTTLMYAATSVRHQGVLNEPVLSTSSDRAEDQESQQRTRAISGRPKVKRPRL